MHRPFMWVPDPNDVHVLAAAVAGHADCIVTSNLKDFSASILMEFGIEAVDSDTFIINQLQLNSTAANSLWGLLRNEWPLRRQYQ